MVREAISTSNQSVINIPGTEEFISRIRGTVLRPGDAAYDQARQVRNGLIDRHPALIVRCSGTADVIEAVNFARDQGVVLSIRGGGHNVAGNAVNDDGLVIDLSGMKAVFVDPVNRTARALGGATWGDLDRETQLYGLAAPGGVVSTTGIGGLTLHGGLGHLRRTYGLSLDNLLSVEIVTADGQVRRASDTENPDLFWAVRGAGSNFGVITSFEFRLHPIGPIVFLCGVAYPIADAPRVLRAWRDFTATAPNNINSMTLLWNIPDSEHFPAEVRNAPVALVAGVYVGSPEDGERVLKPLRELGTPLLDLSGPMLYTAIQAAFDPFFPMGRLYYWKSTYIDMLPDVAIDTMVERAALRPSPMTDQILWHLGGAISRADPDGASFGRRTAPYLYTAESTWTDRADNDRNIAWARESLAAMKPYSNGGLYINFPGFGEEKESMLRDAFGAHYDRLASLKAAYDPTNLFRMNLNIKPQT